MKITKSENQKIQEYLEDLSNSEYKGRFLVKESYDKLADAIENKLPIPDNLQKYLKDLPKIKE
jgi:hypothetical protein